MTGCEGCMSDQMHVWHMSQLLITAVYEDTKVACTGGTMEISGVFRGVFDDSVCPPRQEGWQGEYCRLCSHNDDTLTILHTMSAADKSNSDICDAISRVLTARQLLAVRRWLWNDPMCCVCDCCRLAFSSLSLVS